MIRTNCKRTGFSLDGIVGRRDDPRDHRGDHRAARRRFRATRRRQKVNAHNKATINAAVERWYVEKGTWPANNLSDIGADTNYFPDGLPTNPVERHAVHAQRDDAPRELVRLEGRRDMIRSHLHDTNSVMARRAAARRAMTLLELIAVVVHHRPRWA